MTTPLAYLRTLAAVEHAHILGDDDAIVSILAGVDPADLRQLIADLETVAPEPRGDSPDRSLPVPDHGSPLHSPGASGATDIYPVVDYHANDHWSVKR